MWSVGCIFAEMLSALSSTDVRAHMAICIPACGAHGDMHSRVRSRDGVRARAQPPVLFDEQQFLVLFVGFELTLSRLAAARG